MSVGLCLSDYAEYPSRLLYPQRNSRILSTHEMDRAISPSAVVPRYSSHIPVYFAVPRKLVNKVPGMIVSVAHGLSVIAVRD